MASGGGVPNEAGSLSAPREAVMATVNMLGLVDHGRRISDEVFETADFEPGYKYELIDGRLYVAPDPNMPEVTLEEWIGFQLRLYAFNNPDVVNFVAGKSRVFIPGRRRTTCPQPDLSAYRDIPTGQPIDQRDWRSVSPFLVVEVLKDSDPHKDLVRNVGLYLQVPSIREYWVLDGRISADEPILLVRRRRGGSWLRAREVPYGETYTTPLLPGFSLLVDPHS
jgi:Uma2 family endonuclease